MYLAAYDLRRGENFSVVATPIESEHAFVWIAMPESRFHYPPDDFCRIAGVTARLVIEHGHRDRIFDRQMAATNLHLIEHYFLGDVRRPLVPSWTPVVELDGQDGSRAHIGTTVSNTSSTHEFQAYIEIRVVHKAPITLGSKLRLSNLGVSHFWAERKAPGPGCHCVPRPFAQLIRNARWPERRWRTTVLGSARST